MALLQALRWRYAVKQFSNQTLEEQRLQELLQATQLSPSAYGLQPYRLLVINDKSLRQRLLEHSYGQQKVVHSSHLVVFAGYRDIDAEFVEQHMQRVETARDLDAQSRAAMAQHYLDALITQPGLAQRQQWIRDQTYLALGNFLTSAAILEIDACPMTGIVPQEYDRLLGLDSQGLTTIAIAALGSRDPQDSHANLPKVRKSLEELVQRIQA